MKITYVGSASFIIEISGVRILTDPWYWGNGFINGWSPLIYPSQDYSFGEIDYIWFSHEHPDHFHPPTLNILINKLKKKPKILFQYTLNKRVVNFLKKKHELDVLEVETYKPLKINENLEILIGDIGMYDSYIQLKNDKYCFTHLNDCLVNNNSQFNKIKKFSGKKTHVLTSQYGLAHGPCGKNDTEKILLCKEQKLNLFKSQIENVSPVYAIPSSSAIHFSCSDNNWMNKFRASPDEAIAKLKGSKTKMLYPTPFKIYNFDNPTHLNAEFYDNNTFINAINSTLQKINDDSEPTISIEELTASVKLRAEELNKLNSRILLVLIRKFFGLAKQITFQVKDLNIFLTIDPLRGSVCEIEFSKEAIVINSYVLNQLYRSPYGVDALNASARYDILGVYNIETLNNHLNIATLNTAGIYFNIKKLFKVEVILKLLRVFKQWYNFHKQEKNEYKQI
jgi:hypothetical protein